MAGIGFELRKIFKKNSVIAKLRGSAFAAVITVGPLIMIIVTLFLMYLFLGYSDILFASRELLANTILYIFIFSLCSTAPFNAVISRYIADKIYENQEQDILPCYYVTLTANVVLCSIIGICFCLWEYFVGQVDLVFVFSSFCAYMGLAIIFINMLYIILIKEYQKITYSFIVGLLVALILGVVQVKLFGVEVQQAVIAAFAVGFWIIGFCLMGSVKKFFKENSRNYRGVFEYFKVHWRLLATNALYIFGLYVHNFVYWTTHLQTVVVKSFVAAPAYDMATCIAMFLNISTMVIFIVQVETNFHEKYQNYCQTLMGGTGEDIEYAKGEMFRSIKNEIFFVVQIQVIFTVAGFFVFLFLLPMISIGELITTMLPTMVVAYFLIFIMYCMIIFIYYFNQYTAAMITAGIFFVGNLVGSLIFKNTTPAFYAMGALLAALAAFTYAYYTIRRIEKNLDYYIYCEGLITPVIVDKKYGQKIYENKTI